MAAKVFPVQTISNPTVPTGITIPPGGLEEIIVFVQGGDIRFTDYPLRADGIGETISSSVGTLVGDGNSFEYRGDFLNLRFIAAAGTPDIRVHKYQRTTAW